MTGFFAPEQTVWLEKAAGRCEIRELLQLNRLGPLYRVIYQGQDGALQWYDPPFATPARRALLERQIAAGTPGGRFRWPQDIGLFQGFPGFGSLAPLPDHHYRALADLMAGRVDLTFRALTTLALGVAESFQELHAAGYLCEQVDFEMISFDPATGVVSIGTPDRLVIAGEDASPEDAGLRFLAPERVRAESAPSLAADLHTLATLLFHFFLVHHPLEGRRERELECLDFPAFVRLYGGEPLFIFDPADGANRPVAGVHDNAIVFWRFYPKYLRDVFTRAFTDGLRQPGARITANEWRAVLSRMRDQIYYCHACGAENLLSDDADSGPAPDAECWSCGQRLIAPLRMRIGSHAVVLNQDTVLYGHHLDTNQRYDFSEVMAEMKPHPKRNEIWGLRNTSSHPWVSRPPAGSQVAVPPGRSVSLVSGLRIHFGTLEGEIL